jgi:phosphoribosylamine--glycine ligase
MDALPKDRIQMFFNEGTTLGKGGIEANGGSVQNITGRGDSLKEARDWAYALIVQIDWPEGYFRPYIGWKAL